jgi:outer membrane protein assembly factor BamD (BamD/ComL family)
MRRVACWLTIIGVLAAITASAWAGWVWRDGQWIYVDETEPPLPAPKRPVKPPAKPPTKPPAEPVPPTPKPAEPAEPTEAPGPAPKPETPASPAAEEPIHKVDTPPSGTEGAGRWGINWRFWQRSAGPNADKDLFDEGKGSLSAGRLSSAAATFKKLIKDCPSSAHREEAMWLRAGILFDQKDYYKAYEQYEELLTQYAGNVHYRDALLKEIEIAELFLGPARRRVLGIPLLSGETEAIEILRRVYEHQPAGDLADDVVLRIADYNWSKGRWIEAEDYYDKYCREYPNGDAILHAELRRAKCAIERCRGPRYDVTCLQLAYDRLRQYQRKFPAEASREGVPDLLVAVRDRQASALYEIAARYRRSGKPLAAAFYAERLQERYPDSPWSVKAGEFLAGASMEPGPPDGRPGEQEPGK